MNDWTLTDYATAVAKANAAYGKAGTPEAASAAYQAVMQAWYASVKDDRR